VPFLRVLRDKRGYETTYLMHWVREGARQRSRILYVFRTPPGVRVGRDPLDPEIVRELQASYPDIEFDWRALRQNQQIVESSAEPRRRGSARAKRAGDEAPAAPVQRPEPAAEPAEEPAAVPPARLVIPSRIEGSTREEQFVFLLRLYMDLRERVPHRTHDPIRREALRALVERLNPEAWVGEEAIETGLQQAAEALERLSHIFGKRRRRPRRARGDRAAPAGAPAVEGAAHTEGADSREGDTGPPGSGSPESANTTDLPEPE